MVLVGVDGFLAFHFEAFPPGRSKAQAPLLTVFTWQGSCFDVTGKQYEDDFCNHLEVRRKSPSIVMSGDSFAASYSPMMKRWSDHDGRSFTEFGRGHCPMLVNYGPKICSEIMNPAHEYIKREASVKTVVMAGDWPAYSDGKHWINWGYREDSAAFVSALEKTISLYESWNKKVVLLFANPQGADPQCQDRPKIRIFGKNLTADQCALPEAKARLKDGNYRERIKIILQKHPGVHVFDPFKYLCDGEECKVSDGKYQYYVDHYGHLSDTAGAYLADKAKMELSEILRP